LFCSAVSSVYKEYLCKEEGNSTGEYDMAGLAHWIAEECDLFRFKEKLECNFEGTLELYPQSAYIHRGAAMSNIKNFDKGMQQMDEQASVIEFALAIIFKDKPFDIYMRYHVF
jgi:hypothetical protein